MALPVILLGCGGSEAAGSRMRRYGWCPDSEVSRGFQELWGCCLPRQGKCSSYCKAPNPRVPTQVSPAVLLGPRVAPQAGLPQQTHLTVATPRRVPLTSYMCLLIFFNKKEKLPKRYKSATCFLQKCSRIVENWKSKQLKLTFNQLSPQCFRV